MRGIELEHARDGSLGEVFDHEPITGQLAMFRDRRRTALSPC
jgi:hypothetical protein